jgi:hypothetical protein
MKPGQTLVSAFSLIAFAAAAQAECLGVHHPIQSAPNALAIGTVAANKLVANKITANKITANKLSANKLAASGGPGDGAASAVVAIELPNGTRLSR